MTDATDFPVPPVPKVVFSATAAEDRMEPVAVDVPGLSFRQVHRAVAELRRGVPVILEGNRPLLVLAAEGASMAGLQEMAALAAEKGCLVLAGRRAADISGHSVSSDALLAFALPDGGLDPGRICEVADPTVEQLAADPLVEVGLPGLADAGLLLVKLARLLPAMVAAPLAAGNWSVCRLLMSCITRWRRRRGWCGWPRRRCRSRMRRTRALWHSGRRMPA